MLKKIKNKIVQYFFLQIQQLQHKKELQELEILKRQFKKVGVGFGLGKDYSVLNPQFIEIGDNFSAGSRFRIEAWDKYNNKEFNPEIVIGNNVVFNTDIHIGCINRIEIGDNCLFASRIYITDHDHGDTTVDSLTQIPIERDLFSKGIVRIKNNVWIGEGAVILSGVSIGENSIIASNAVVTKNFPANSVIGGVPAKIIKKV